MEKCGPGDGGGRRGETNLTTSGGRAGSFRDLEKCVGESCCTEESPFFGIHEKERIKVSITNFSDGAEYQQNKSLIYVSVDVNYCAARLHSMLDFTD